MPNEYILPNSDHGKKLRWIIIFFLHANFEFSHAWAATVRLVSRIQFALIYTLPSHRDTNGNVPNGNIPNGNVPNGNVLN